MNGSLAASVRSYCRKGFQFEGVISIQFRQSEFLFVTFTVANIKISERCCFFRRGYHENVVLLASRNEVLKNRFEKYVTVIIHGNVASYG